MWLKPVKNKINGKLKKELKQLIILTYLLNNNSLEIYIYDYIICIEDWLCKRKVESDRFW